MDSVNILCAASGYKIKVAHLKLQNTAALIPASKEQQTVTMQVFIMFHSVFDSVQSNN